MELFMSNIRPLHDRVVIRRVEEETKTAGGMLKVKSLQLVMVKSLTMAYAR